MYIQWGDIRMSEEQYLEISTALNEVIVTLEDILYSSDNVDISKYYGRIISELKLGSNHLDILYYSKVRYMK